MTQPQNMVIDQCVLKLRGPEVIAIINGLHELPHKIAAPVLASIEAQLREQFPMIPPTPAAEVIGDVVPRKKR